MLGESLDLLFARLGNVPADRVRLRPLPGTATEADLLNSLGPLRTAVCELIDGVLVEKPADFGESVFNASVAAIVGHYVRVHNLGLISGPAGPFRLRPMLVRLPDVAFTSWDRLPGRRRPSEPIPDLAPDLAIEVLSAKNTPQEMSIKRQDFFGAGTQLVWEIDPETRTVRVYTAPDTFTTLTAVDALDGRPVLPGFTLPLAEVFAELDRQG